MTLSEAFLFCFIVLSCASFTTALLFFAYRGLRQFIADANYGSLHRTEDDDFRRSLHSITGGAK